MKSKLQKWLITTDDDVVDAWLKALQKEESQLTEKDYEQINETQRIIGENYVQEHLEWYKARFNNLYGNSRKPERLITDEIQGYQAVLSDKDLTNVGIYYNLGEAFTLCGAKYSDTSDKGYYNEIAYYYKHTWVRPTKAFWHNVSPRENKRPYQYVSSLMAEVIARYVEWLESLRLEGPSGKVITEHTPSPDDSPAFSPFPFDEKTILEVVVEKVREQYGPLDARGERTLENCMADAVLELKKEIREWGSKEKKYGISPLIGQIRLNLEKWEDHLRSLHSAQDWPRGNGARWNPQEWFIAKCGVTFTELLLEYAQENPKGKISSHRQRTGEGVEGTESPNEEPSGTEPNTFEELFENEEKAEKVIRIMKETGITDSVGVWKGGKFKSRIMAVVYALCDKAYIDRTYYKKAAYLIAQKIGTTIGQRTIQETHEDLLHKAARAKYKEYYERMIEEL